MNTVWLVGTGFIGIEYAKVLKALNLEFIAIGRGQKSAVKFEKETGCTVIQGGLDKFIMTNPIQPKYVIVAVGVESLANTTQRLIEYGIKRILVEKPGIAHYSEINSLVKYSIEKGAKVFLAYNRRFYSSVLKAQEIIEEDGGITSFNFEFTEWAHIIEKLEKPENVFKNWFLANSTHVIDTAFFLGGEPVELCAFHRGSLKWHPSSSIFSGAGISDKGALFSYQANWNAPGRWSVEILTSKHRLYLKPMETLQIQEIGNVSVSPVNIDNHLDIEFKPGFYLQTKAFLEDNISHFCTIEQQKKMIEKYYLKMSGYLK